MLNETTPKYITELKTDLINHIDSSINTLVLTINKTVALKDDIKNMATKDDIKNMATKDDIKDMVRKEDIKDMATKDDIKEIWDNMTTKSDVKEILSHIGRYEVRTRNIEEILLEDHKPRIIDLEKEVYL